MITKGEWTIEPVGVAGNPNHKMIIGHPNPKDFQVIRTIGRLFDYGTKEENKANAQLIITAPDLLVACEAQEKADNWFGASDTGRKLKNEAAELRRIAITKATKK